jgi:hypothetical protein
MKREDVFKLIDRERTYQDFKWGDHNKNKFHEPEAWILYMEYWLDRAKILLSTEHVDSAYPLAMGHIRKVAAKTMTLLLERKANEVIGEKGRRIQVN